MTYDFCIPTYQRYDKLKKCLEFIPVQDNIVIHVYFDNNDFETLDKINELDLAHHVFVMEKKYQAFGIWNYHLKHLFNSDVMVYLCDDVYLWPDTMKNMERHFNEKFPDTDGVITFKQENLKGSDSAMGCIGRKFVERYPDNQVFNPNYVSFYADTDLGNYAKKLSKFHYGEDCLIHHAHPITGVKADTTHHIIRGIEKTIDIQVNKIRKEKGLLYPINLEMIDRETV